MTIGLGGGASFVKWRRATRQKISTSASSASGKTQEDGTSLPRSHRPVFGSVGDDNPLPLFMTLVRVACRMRLPELVNDGGRGD